MDEFKVKAALAGSRCWCGEPAVFTRQGEDVQTDYCGWHWAIWWEAALLSGLVVTMST